MRLAVTTQVGIHQLCQVERGYAATDHRRTQEEAIELHGTSRGWQNELSVYEVGRYGLAAITAATVDVGTICAATWGAIMRKIRTSSP
jgi:hypothetical protein